MCILLQCRTLPLQMAATKGCYTLCMCVSLLSYISPGRRDAMVLGWKDQMQNRWAEEIFETVWLLWVCECVSGEGDYCDGVVTCWLIVTQFKLKLLIIELAGQLKLSTNQVKIVSVSEKNLRSCALKVTGYARPRTSKLWGKKSC